MPAVRSRLVEAVMTRVLMGMAAVWTVAVMPAWANAPDIKATREGRSAATITLRHGALTVTQRLSDTRLDLHVVQGDDSVELSADLAGRVAIARADARRAFEVRRATRDDQAAFKNIVSESSALSAFETMMQSSWARTDAAAPFRSTRELIRVLQGDYNAVDYMAATRVTPATPMASIVFARQRLSPSQCWDTYAQDVVKFTYDLQSCLSQVIGNWWNPLHTAWCSYEYNLKSSLASIWLLDCYGVGV
jgi:hypothetical protein